MKRQLLTAIIRLMEFSLFLVLLVVFFYATEIARAPVKFIYYNF